MPRAVDRSEPRSSKASITLERRELDGVMVVAMIGRVDVLLVEGGQVILIRGLPHHVGGALVEAGI